MPPMDFLASIGAQEYRGLPGKFLFALFHHDRQDLTTVRKATQYDHNVIYTECMMPLRT